MSWFKLEAALDAAYGVDPHLVERCRRALELLSDSARQTIDPEALVLSAAQTSSARWLANVDSLFEAAFRPAKVLVLKTMHLVHGQREGFPFDENTTLREVQSHLVSRHHETLIQYLMRHDDHAGTDDLQLEFYPGTLIAETPPPPLDPDTRVSTIPDSDIDGVYWWPKVRMPKNDREVRGVVSAGTAGLLSGEIHLMEASSRLWTRRRVEIQEEDLSVGSIFLLRDFGIARSEPSRKRRAAPTRTDSLQDRVRKAMVAVLTGALHDSTEDERPSVEQLLERLSLQFIGESPQQSLAIRCGDIAAEVSLFDENAAELAGKISAHIQGEQEALVRDGILIEERPHADGNRHRSAGRASARDRRGRPR